MSDENRDPHFDPDTISGMGGAGDGGGAAPLPLPLDVPIERVLFNDPFADGGTRPMTDSNQPEAPEEPETGGDENSTN